MKNIRLVEVAKHAYCLIGGLPEPEDLDENEKEYWATIPSEDIKLASHWKLVSTGPLYDLLMKFSKIDHDRVNPYPGGPTLNTDELETFRIPGEDESALIWRDVCITWYKRPGRCMCASRDLTDEELVQLEQELNKAIEKP
ncbi:hypothetical protein [Pseudomonas phage vB_PaeM_PS119XW]|uniref:Uncharacterized protein n=1 Tax=Pseudomonas phage vB_PaeM_PS119XW TaxID=2601632 RepID=A0A5C1K7E7_9CAUD|nr:hypothetical protein PP933_gp308 [Pseudomonas phage vB_PaeM_PS119XW]QEM42037.1 hypothetical protein [Pseudomonas phage vB_PaeM_PS119XW]